MTFFIRKLLKKRDEFEQINSRGESLSGTGSLPSPDSLNDPFTLAEVSEAIDRAKSGKSYLLIPNEAMKNANAKQLLHRFFNTC